MSTTEETIKQQGSMNTEGQVADFDLAQKMATEEEQYRSLADSSTSTEEVERVANEASEAVFQQETGQEFGQAVEHAREEVEKISSEVVAETDKSYKIVSSVSGAEPQDLEEAKAAGLKLVSQVGSVGAELLQTLGNDFLEQPKQSETEPAPDAALSHIHTEILQAKEECQKGLAMIEDLKNPNRSAFLKKEAALHGISTPDMGKLRGIIGGIFENQQAVLEDLASKAEQSKTIEEYTALLEEYKEEMRQAIKSELRTLRNKKDTEANKAREDRRLRRQNNLIFQMIDRYTPENLTTTNPAEAVVAPPRVVASEQTGETLPSTTGSTEENPLADLPPIEETMKQATEQTVEPPASSQNEENPLADLPPIEETMAQATQERSQKTEAPSDILKTSVELAMEKVSTKDAREESPSVEKHESPRIKSFKTAQGSIYSYNSKGKTTRFKTATNEQMEQQDITVFSELTPDDEQGFLQSIHGDTRTKVYVVEELNDGNLKIIRDISEVSNPENVYLASAQDGKWVRKKRASLTPVVGYNTFDMRQFEENGETKTERHLGNKVTEIEIEQEKPISTEASAESKPAAEASDHDRWNEILKRTAARLKEEEENFRKAQESGDTSAESIAKKQMEHDLVIERNIREKMKQAGQEVPPPALETQVVVTGAASAEAVLSGTKQEVALKETNTELETIKTKTELSPEQQERLENDFAEFGFTKEDVEGIEGFTDLTYGQQRLALENLKQLTLKEIQTKGTLAYRDEKSQLNSWYKKVWQGITKKYQIAKEQKRAAGDMVKSEYLTLLKDVVAGAKETNLEVVEKEGDLEIQYLSGLENLSEAEQRRVDRFNQVATELSRMPYEWSLDTATPSEQSRYKAVAAEYQSLLRSSEVDLETGQETLGVIDLLKRDTANKHKEENAEAKISAETQTQFGKIDNLVRLNQFLNTHPEVEEQLAHIKSAPAWKQVWKDIVTERGLYMVAGATIRSAAIGVLGSVAGVVGGAALMGGLIARRRAGEQLREQDMLARQGVKNESETAKGMNVARAVDSEKEKKDLTVEEKGSLSRKLDYLTERITEESDPENRLKLVKSLEARVAYTKQKIEQGLVDFGSSDERTANQYELINQLNLAENCVGLYNAEEKTGHLKRPELEERLEALMDARTQKVDKARRSFRNRQMAKGALYGAAFAGAGAAARWFYDHVSIDPFVRPGADGGTEVGVGVKLGNSQIEQHVVSPEAVSQVSGELKPGRIIISDEVSGSETGHSAMGGPEMPSASTVVAGVKAPEAVTRLVDEIRNAGGVKHDSIWRSAHELVQKNADTLGVKYPGPEGTKLSEAAWYNMKTSELVNELSQKTPGGIKDLIHEGDQVTLSRGPDARFHLGLEETSGVKAGHIVHIEDVTKPEVVPAAPAPVDTPFSSFDAHQMEMAHSVNLPPQHGTDAEVAGLREAAHLKDLEKQLGVETVNPPQAPKEVAVAAAAEQVAQQQPTETTLPVGEKIVEPTSAPKVEVPKAPHMAEASDITSSGESTIKLQADSIAGEIHFKYDANGNPEELSYDPDGLLITKATGREFVDASKTFDLARKHHLSEQTFRDQLSRDGLNLVTKNVKIYEELRHAGESKEADFVRRIIEHNTEEMEQKFGTGIIDQKKLAEALNK